MALNNNSFINNLWMEYCNNHSNRHYKEDWSWLKAKRVPDYESLKASEWDEQFFQKILNTSGIGNAMESTEVDELRNLLRNRMVMGAMRYGLVSGSHHKSYNHLSSVNDRLKLAESTKTWEPLLDCFNMYYLAHRIAETKRQKLDIVVDACGILWYIYEVQDCTNWSLGAVDDGAHTEKNI